MKIKNNKSILVIGATGDQGYTVALELLNHGFPVRAMITPKSINHLKANTLKLMGSELFVADLDNEQQMQDALKNMWGVFSVLPPSANRNKEDISRMKRLIRLSKKAGIKSIVHSSVNQVGNHLSFANWEAGKWSPAYWLEKNEVDQHLKNAGFEYWTILKPVFLMENFKRPKSIFMFPQLNGGLLLSSFKPLAPIQLTSSEDIGKFANAAFSNPARFTGLSIDLMSEELNIVEIGKQLSGATSLPIVTTSLTAVEAIEQGISEGVVSSQQWNNDVGYNADLATVKAFQIPLLNFREWCLIHALEI